MRLAVSELRMRRTSLLVWVASIAALVGMLVAFYPQIRDDPSLNSLYEGMSPSMQALLGGSDLTSPTGYLNTQLFAFFLPAVLLVFGLGRGASSVAGEEEERTLDLLLAQPVPRSSAYAQKALAVTVSLVLLGVTALVVLLAGNNPVEFDLPVANLVAVSLSMTLFCLGLSLAAQAIAAATGRRAIGLAVVAGYAFVSYVVYGLGATISWLAHLRPLTLWRWYLLDDPLGTGFHWLDVAVLAAVCVVAVATGIVLFGRRQLRA